jgi:hypothetical protein
MLGLNIKMTKAPYTQRVQLRNRSRRLPAEISEKDLNEKQDPYGLKGCLGAVKILLYSHEGTIFC